jgi:hypothetical protein
MMPREHIEQFRDARGAGLTPPEVIEADSKLQRSASNGAMNAPDRVKRLRRSRLPAFGRALVELRRRGLVPNPPQIYVAIDWWKWRRGRLQVVVTPDSDPAELDFAFLAGLDVIVGWRPELTSRERRDSAIRAILRGVPQRLLLFVYGEGPAHVWIKSVGSGIEPSEFQ